MFHFVLLVFLFIPQLRAAVPAPWQTMFQTPASPPMEDINSLHNLLLYIIFAIAVVVTLLLAYVIYRFRASKNPTPSGATHNTLLEIVWTVIPVIILIVIGIPSVKLLYKLDKPQDPEMTVKAIGHQWYWSYEYPVGDSGQFAFDSYMIEDVDIKPGQFRLLEVDKPMVIPVDTTVRILVTAADVLHSFAVPALGIKKDAVPGRINETWLHIKKPGMYYGQCSELCGVKHGFMPIAVKAVSKEEYQNWLQENQKQGG
jgi:cytochrome c oxidase subunit 2